MIWFVGILCLLIGFALGAAARSGPSGRGGYSPLAEADTSAFPLGGSQVVPIESQQEKQEGE